MYAAIDEPTPNGAYRTNLPLALLSTINIYKESQVECFHIIGFLLDNIYITMGFLEHSLAACTARL
jgi:hypothetical protein